MIVTNITKTVNIPGEQETATIRKLSHKQLKAAAKARQSEGVGFMRELGAELMTALRNADTQAVKNIQETQQADITNYDRDTLLKLGIVAWSYPIPPVYERDKDGNALKVNGKLVESPDEPLIDGIDQQDEPTAKWLAEQIFEYSRPETKAEAKNV
jgi:uncharacterized membrane-anchored protein